MDIIAIIPAYNEEKTIKDVIKAVKETEIVSHIIVVSDGSIDSTCSAAGSMGVQVVELKSNVGKGGAMKAGLDACRGDIILFLDADLIGLKKEHIIKILDPVVNGRAEMSIGVFANGRLATDLAQKITPFLSGQRAVKRYVLDGMPDFNITKFGVEVALTRYAMEGNIKIEKVELPEMSHYTKEEKLGLYRGAIARIKMYWDIIKCLKPVRMK
jgi:Glycosyltransferases involved in cell wall biogenesis